MEFPCLIMIGKDCYTGTGRDFGETCIAHEIAHQWWYSAVGSDQINTPWVDESLAEYLGFLYWRERYGTGAFEAAWNAGIGASENDLVQPVGASIYEFDNWRDYADVVYYQGARMFKALHEKLGDDVFFGALRQYYEDHCNLNVSEDDLIRAFSDAAGEDLEPFFREWGIGQ
jgi:aminopeptidase N